MPVPELVVLTDDTGLPTGVAPKAEVHSTDTPLHLAFSCHLLSPTGDVLLTRRALSKKTWPGVWTNSFCGHPGPGESLEDAVRRRAADELGVEISALTLALPDYRYRAVDASGIVENEICPVFVAVVDDPLRPDRDEVVEWAWVTPDSLADAVTGAPFVFSPWMREQIPQLLAQGALTRASPTEVPA